MNVYFINIFMILIFAMLNNIMRNPSGISNNSSNRQKIGHKCYMVIVALQLIAISGFRAKSIGSDNGNYLRVFELAQLNSWREFFNIPKYYLHGFEKGFLAYYKILATLHFNFQGFMLVTAIVTLGITCYFIYRNSKIPWLSIYLFCTLGYFNSSMCTIRQWLAISITLLSIRFIKQRNLKSFIIIIIIASLFHTTALSVIPLYWFNKIKINRKYYLFVSTVGASVFFLHNDILQLFLHVLPRYSSYVNSKYGGSQGGYYQLLLILFLILFGQLMRHSMLNKDESMSLYFHTLSLALFLQIIALFFAVFGRIIDYYLIYIIIYIPNCIKCLGDKKLRVLAIIGVVVLTVGYYYTILLHNTTRTVPFMFT